MPRFLSIGRAALERIHFHNHTTWEISVYTRGAGVATVGTQRIPFQPGTIICYPPVIAHKEDSNSKYAEYYMHTDVLRLGTETTPVFSDTEQRVFTRLAEVLYDEFHLRRPGWEQITQDLFDILVSHLQRSRKSHPAHPAVEQLKHLLVQNFHRAEFEVGKAMRRLPLSVDHLREQFERATGMTPVRFLIQLRIDEARRLLKHGYSVKEAGHRVGYPDPYYFSRIFLKTAGARPSAYASKNDFSPENA